MNLYGAKFKEVVGVINSIAKNGEWSRRNDVWIAEGKIAGSLLRVREKFINIDKLGMQMSEISISGNDWLASFKVNLRRPSSLPQTERSEMIKINFPDIFTRRQNNLSGLYDGKVVCLHTSCVISPEEFRTQMTILKMFTSVWED